MPHYQDGTKAEIGDLVVGKTYNLNGRVIVGTVLEIIPGTDSCNARVAFADVSTRPDENVRDGDVVYRSSYTQDFTPRIVKAGFDYGETKAFTLFSRPAS